MNGLLLPHRLAALGFTALMLVAGACHPHARLEDIRRRVEQTDGEALLAACREIHVRRTSYRVNPHYNGGDESLRGRAPDPQDPAIPAVVRDLKPTYIEVFDDFVHICWGAGIHRVDVTAFLPEVKEKPRGRQLAETARVARRLVPGLWYYEDRD